MGRRKETIPTRSHTLPSSPTHSLSSSDFEFTISLSPKKSSAADELFYKGQLLPLHLSPRISMVRTLLASSSSSSASRDSTTSSNDSRSSFSTDPECDEYKRLTSPTSTYIHPQIITSTSKKTNYFSLSRFSSLFRKESTTSDPELESASSLKKMSATIRKYLKKAKPLYQKLSQNQIPINPNKTDKVNLCMKADGSVKCNDNRSNTIMIGFKENVSATITHSFSGNLRYPRRRNIVTSCPSSIKSSPSHSRVFSKNKNVGCNNFQDSSSMEELQSAIQGAIAHCKNSLLQEK
ncbi:hypothetical protein Leryth_016981 [Lithospermum erythrorhizon]|nr:hypothetical protein Leryth_016981 [Lithospermum erythrorhizon]